MEVFAECADWLIVIGGSAVQCYGMARMTFACDCVILDRDEPRLRQALSPFGYVLDDQRVAFTRYRHLGGQRPIVDAMGVNAATLANVWRESRLVKISGLDVRVPAPLHLVAMKLHALKQQPDRAYKDWEDIRFLIEQHRDSWTRESLAGLVERYASAETAEQLRQANLL